jgi:ATP-dependent DNA helicase RecQ
VKSQKTPIIVFVRSRKRAEGTARLLLRRFPDKQVYFYHAGLNKEEREEVERWFFHSSKGILVSTSAYGMGVDKSNIRTVVHYDVPPSVEAYLQESGRAGRDRKPTQAFLLYSPEDLEYELKLRDETSRERYRCISGYAVNQAECRRRYLLRLLNQELSHCSGCDVCSGHKKSDMQGLKEIERFVRCYKKRFSKRQIIYALCGQPSYEAVQSRLTRYSGFGLLKEWDREEIEEAIDSLVELKRIRVLNKGFWRGKLTVGKLS